jgi:hypothetical protein
MSLAALLALVVDATASTMQIGSNFNYVNSNFEGSDGINLGAGSITPTYIDGNLLPYLYCVQIEVDINVPGTYSVAITNNGEIFGTPINNAGEVAYLLNTYAPTATTVDQQGALQAAIWKTIYGSNYDITSNNPADMLTDYNTYMTNVGTDPVSTVEWISPSNGDGSHAQGLITSAVPEPSAIFLAAVAGVIGVARSRIRPKNTSA